MEVIIHISIIFFEIYLLIGFLFAVPLVIKGVEKVDTGAIGACWTFRLLIFPGVLAFWPVLLQKWLKARANGN